VPLGLSTSLLRDAYGERRGVIAVFQDLSDVRELEGVLRHPGLESVLDVGRILWIPTLRFFREKRETAGRVLSLNDIEHGILRERFHEPRIHFVVNCASVSCPALPARAMRGATLGRDLETATRAFLADPDRNRFPETGPIEISKIFDWYADDFVRTSGTVAGFIMAHWPDAAPPALADRRIRHLPYDWSLNGRW
jgi:hypothetical protein